MTELHDHLDPKKVLGGHLRLSTQASEVLMDHGYGLVCFTGSSRLRKGLIAQSTEGLHGSQALEGLLGPQRGLEKAFWRSPWPPSSPAA